LCAYIFAFHFEYVALLKLKLLAKLWLKPFMRIPSHCTLIHIRIYVWKCKLGPWKH